MYKNAKKVNRMLNWLTSWFLLYNCSVLSELRGAQALAYGYS